MSFSPEPLLFRTLRLSDRPAAERQLAADLPQSCDACFATQYIWHRYYHNRIACSADGWLFFRFGDGASVRYLQPGSVQLKERVDRLLSDAHAAGRPTVLFGGNAESAERLERCFPHRFEMQELPGDADYLYDRCKLVSLRGKPYDGKRNHIAAFSRRYRWTYEPLDARNTGDFEQVAQAWMAARDAADSTLTAEYAALQEAIRHRVQLGIDGGLLRVDGHAVAMTLGAPVGTDTFDIQMEKALPGFEGAYAVINREFAARMPEQIQWINRENDLGIEGLRRAKLSYHPARLITKYLCTERM